MIYVKKYRKLDLKFEQIFYSRTEKSMYRIGHNSIILMKWMAYYDKSNENKNFFDLRSSVLSTF